jgi:Adenylate cyclase, class 2 (thermophilic)
MATECEAKIHVDDFDEIRSRLEKLGGVHEGEVLERNWVLDRPDNTLFGEGTLLRVRNTGGPGGVLTVKRKSEGGEFKTREEVESMVDSTDDLLRQLEMVGFGIQWIYEKFRDTWIWQDCILALDECPEMGCFVEIEGTPDTIRAAARDLGLDPAKHIDESYLDLWRNHLRARGESPRHMVFQRNDPILRRLSRSTLIQDR